MEAWHIWIMIGIVCVIIEIFDPIFIFLSLGIGAIATGLISLSPLFGANVYIQILTFCIISFIAFLLMRKLGKKVLQHPDFETNVYALVGKTAVILEDIPADGKGHVKIGGEEWVAVVKDGKALAKGSKATVLEIEGNKVIIS
ncbi:MAG: NfeD family protein [Candidatus Cloacimonetes bacterium]|nr:NfeD family protein [Candidatus Cloacimonadota bacterium]